MPTETLMPTSGIKDETQLVTFLLQEEEFGFDIMSVQEIIRPPKLAKIPRTPPFVDGVANLRGVVLPVVDMRARFGMDRGEETDRTRVLIVDIEGVKTGLRVDRVKQVTRVQRGDIEAPPLAIRGTTVDYLQGVVKLDKGERIIMALNAGEVCRIGVERGGATPGESAAASQAGATPTTLDGALDAGVQQMVTFRIASEEFALPMEQVREILRVETPKQVPDVPAYVLGVVTVRGQVLPIIDLRQLLNQRSLADEVAGACREVRAEYESWLEQVGSAALHADQVRAGLGVTEAARNWLANVSCSSQALMECLAQIRSGNEKTTRQLQDRAQWQDAVAGAASTIGSLREFEKRVAANIQEDQRVIVVDAGGLVLGLVVDRVNEVLNISRSLTDPPPAIASTGMELAGIAKLNGGSRLIMLLDSGNLFRDERIRAMRQASDSSEAGEGQKVTANQERSRDELQLVTFLLGEEEYGIPISQIQEIDRISKVTKVPKAARFVEGITNLRGEVIPVVDTRRRFSLAEKKDDDRTRIVIVDLNGVKTGLVVDSVREVLSLPAKDIAPPPAGIQAALDQRFISGIGKVDDGKRMIVLLNVAEILGGEGRPERTAVEP